MNDYELRERQNSEETLIHSSSSSSLSPNEIQPEHFSNIIMNQSKNGLFFNKVLNFNQFHNEPEDDFSFLSKFAKKKFKERN